MQSEEEFINKLFDETMEEYAQSQPEKPKDKVTAGKDTCNCEKEYDVELLSIEPPIAKCTNCGKLISDKTKKRLNEDYHSLDNMFEGIEPPSGIVEEELRVVGVNYFAEDLLREEAEEILEKHLGFITCHKKESENINNAFIKPILAAMEEYASKSKEVADEGLRVTDVSFLTGEIVRICDEFISFRNKCIGVEKKILDFTSQFKLLPEKTVTDEEIENAAIHLTDPYKGGFIKGAKAMRDWWSK